MTIWTNLTNLIPAVRRRREAKAQAKRWEDDAASELTEKLSAEYQRLHSRVATMARLADETGAGKVQMRPFAPRSAHPRVEESWRRNEATPSTRRDDDLAYAVLIALSAQSPPDAQPTTPNIHAISSGDGGDFSGAGASGSWESSPSDSSSSSSSDSGSSSDSSCSSSD